VLPAIYSNVPAAAIAEIVSRDYGLGALAWARFISRGNNDVYGLRTTDGRRYIARLNHRRIRGPSNTAFETTFLAYLKAAGAPVAAAVPARDGTLWRMLAAAEGEREFAVFEHFPGVAPQMEAGDYRVFGRTLGQVLSSAHSFDGAGSLYRNDLERVLWDPARRLAAVPYFDDAMRASISACADCVGARLSPLLDALAWQVGHGDAAPVNCHIFGREAGRTGGMIDFEEAAPTWMAHEISHVLFHLTRFSEPGVYSDEQRRLWAAFLEGLCAELPLADRDLEAIIAFVPVRWILWAAFFADRLDDWGSANLQPGWLRGQLVKTERWLQAEAPRT
jgi:Ser/Thr protein kinase RdoA (MazF antagonist)